MDQASRLACVNKSGKVPASSKMQQRITTPIQSFTFSDVAANGTVAGSLVLGTPVPSAIQSCPGGMTPTITSVTYTNVQIVDTISHATMAIPGTFTFVSPDVIESNGR